MSCIEVKPFNFCRCHDLDFRHAQSSYVFIQRCLPNRLALDGQDEEWHTIVNFGFQLIPQLSAAITAGESHEDVLPRDPLYSELIATLARALPSQKLKKWKTRGGYKEKFCNAFSALRPRFNPIVSALSFQEKTLRNSKRALLNAFNRKFGGPEGRGINFGEISDLKGRRQMTYEFVNFHSYHKVAASDNKMLVMLLMAWLPQ